jgi:predicted transcriptional regulator
MITTSFLSLTASDLMSRSVLCLPHELSMRQAARLLAQHEVSGAPVTDSQGRCIGVISATDFLSLVEKGEPHCPVPEFPVTCGYQRKQQLPSGQVIIHCLLPPGACPMQRKHLAPDGQVSVTCCEPHSVCADWQVVEMEKLPTDEVRRYMTPDPVTVSAAVSIGRLAQRMIDAHIHRAIVVDQEDRPIGIVSSTDILAAVARLHQEGESSPTEFSGSAKLPAKG